MPSTGQVLEHIARYIRAVTAPVLTSQQGAAEIALDTTTGTLKFGADSGTTKEVLDLTSSQTITGTKTFSGTVALTGAVTGVRGATVTGTANVAIDAASSGTVYVCTKATTAPGQVMTLPAAATAGLRYTFICGNAGGEITVAVATGDKIVGKTHGAENATGISTTTTTGVLVNTTASNVVGDVCTLQSDGVTTWYMVAVAGVWAAA